MYRVEIRTSARRALDDLPAAARERVEAAILALADNPRPPGSRKLKRHDVWRIRVGVYRAIYEVIDDRLLVVVVRVGHRSTVYRRAGDL